MFPGDSNVQPSLRTTLISYLVWPDISSRLSSHICFLTALKVVKEKKKKAVYYFFMEWFYRVENVSVSNLRILHYVMYVIGKVLNLKVVPLR